MIRYPMSFKASAESVAGIQTSWTSQVPNQESLTLAIPPEFDGPGGGFSPEDFYVLALQNCFLATFKVFAEKSRLQYQTLKAEAELIVDRDEQGRPWMAQLLLKVTLGGTEQKDLATRVLQRTSENCMILNSVKTQIKIEHDVV